MSEVDRLLAALHKVRRTGDGRWSACCPAHEDRSPSLAVREVDDGRILVHCFGGCSVDSVLGAVGMDLQDLFPKTADNDGRAPVRRAWSAADLIRMAAFEATVVAVVASDLVAGKLLSDSDAARLAEAIGRLNDAAAAING